MTQNRLGTRHYREDEAAVCGASVITERTTPDEGLVTCSRCKAVLDRRGSRDSGRWGSHNRPTLGFARKDGRRVL